MCWLTSKIPIQEQVNSSTIDNLNSKKGNLYLSIRIFFALWTWCAFLYSMYWYIVPKFDTTYDNSNCCIQYWPLYFTHWGLLSVSFYWFFILYLKVKLNRGDSLSSKCDSVIIFFMQFTYTVGLVFSIIIFPLFWFTVYGGKTEIGYLILSINTHGMTMIIITIEWYLNMLIMKWWHIFFVLFAAFWYVVLIIIHYLTNMTNDSGEHHYIYPIVDFHSNPTRASIVAVVIILCGCIVFIAMATIKSVMIRKHMNNEKDDDLSSSRTSPV